MIKKHKHRVLVVAAHPDDELLGCGGTIALHTNSGDEVTSVVVCEGESHRYGIEGVGQANHALEAAACLGVHDIRLLGFPDQKLEQFTLTEIISPLEKVIAEVKPEIVYCQFGGDVNLDHQVLFRAISVATRPTNALIESIYAFDTASSTEWGYPRTFIPDTWIDISATIEKKLEAMSCYKSELRDFPHPRSIQGLKVRAQGWGVQSCMEYAEVFMTIRQVKRNGKTPS